MKKIDIRKVITDLYEDLDMPISNFGTIYRWAIDCEKRISSSYAMKLVAEKFTITNSSVTLPDEALHVFKIFFGDVTDQIYSIFDIQDTLIVNKSELFGLEYTWSNLDGVTMLEPLWEWLNGDVNFTTNYDGEEITVFYAMLEKNDQGFVNINESHAEAIQYYLQIKAGKRIANKQFLSGRYNGSTRAYMEELESNYRRAVRNAAALDTQESLIDQKLS